MYSTVDQAIVNEEQISNVSKQLVWVTLALLAELRNTL